MIRKNTRLFHSPTRLLLLMRLGICTLPCVTWVSLRLPGIMFCLFVQVTIGCCMTMELVVLPLLKTSWICLLPGRLCCIVGVVKDRRRSLLLLLLTSLPCLHHVLMPFLRQTLLLPTPRLVLAGMTALTCRLLTSVLTVSMIPAALSMLICAACLRFCLSGLMRLRLKCNVFGELVPFMRSLCPWLVRVLVCPCLCVQLLAMLVLPVVTV